MSTRINIDTKDLPLAAAAWQTPKIIGASVWAALAGCTFLTLFIMGATFLKQKSPLFNENAALRRQYYDRCILNFVNQGVRASSTAGRTGPAPLNADAYRAQLDARSR
jgi:hypothetical protein